MQPHNKHACALITGASSGIGAEFARQLASRGYHPILVARREERLAALAEELGSKYGVKPRELAVDLCTSTGAARVEEFISRSTNLEILVNNAGFGINAPFSTGDIQLEMQMISLHVTAAVRLCRAALPAMIERSQGALINVASVAAYFPLSRNATYAASKAYLVTFSRGLHQELARTGVRIQALCPGFTPTEFHDTPSIKEPFYRQRVPGWLWMPAQKIVRSSLRALDRDQPVVIPGMIYRLLVDLSPYIPHWLIRRFYR